MQKRLNEYAKLVGNTPCARVIYRHAGQENEAFFKLEFYNPSGSIKDRMALGVLQDACNKGELRSDSHIVEATSGNTGIALASLAGFLNLDCTIFMPDWMSAERKKLICHYGAKLREVSAAEGGFAGSVDLVNEFASAHKNAFLPRQFENQANALAQMKMAQELAAQVEKSGNKLGAFVAGVGTGGTIMGAKLAYQNSVKCCPLEPEGCAAMSIPGQNAEHRIQGIGDGFVPALVQLSALDDIIVVNDGDAINAARKLAAAGLAVGISSGANLLGTLKAKALYGADCVVASVFTDDAKKYTSTDLMSEQTPQDGWLSNDLEILDYEVIL